MFLTTLHKQRVIAALAEGKAPAELTPKVDAKKTQGFDTTTITAQHKNRVRAELQKIDWLPRSLKARRAINRFILPVTDYR